MITHLKHCLEIIALALFGAAIIMIAAGLSSPAEAGTWRELSREWGVNIDSIAATLPDRQRGGCLAWAETGMPPVKVKGAEERAGASACYQAIANRGIELSYYAPRRRGVHCDATVTGRKSISVFCY